jgi:hypothetical protein
MLVVVAHDRDAAARSLVERWRAAGEDAAVLGPADLSRRGWRFDVGGDGGTSVIDGRLVETRALQGVIVRLVAVTAGELPAIHPEDRVYAAAEMHAFLLAWLDALPCPVLNRPLPVNLSGVPSGTEAWNVRARRLGIAARACRRVVNLGLSSPTPVPGPRPVSVDVVGSRAFTGPARREAEAHDPFAAAAIALAAEAGVELLRCLFDAASPEVPVLLDAGPWVDLASPAVADALTERLLGFVHGPAVGPPFPGGRVALA